MALGSSCWSAMRGLLVAVGCCVVVIFWWDVLGVSAVGFLLGWFLFLRDWVSGAHRCGVE